MTGRAPLLGIPPSRSPFGAVAPIFAPPPATTVTTPVVTPEPGRVRTLPTGIAAPTQGFPRSLRPLLGGAPAAFGPLGE